MKNVKKSPLFRRGLLTLALLAFLCSCKDDKVDAGAYDPSRPVVFTDFSPDEGSVRTRFHIYGDNFGSDPSKIHITIGGRLTTTIGCNGNEIYCIVPPRAFDGTVRVVVDGTDGRTVADYTFEKKLSYLSKTSVGTLVGKVDEYNNAANVDGAFADAEFDSNMAWMLMDTLGTNRYLYVSHPGTSIRKVDLDKQEVSTMITNGQGSFRSMQYMCFDFTGDTIFVSDDNGQNNTNMMAVSYLLRSENFRKAQPYIYDRCGYSCYYHPLNRSLYYNIYWSGEVRRAVYDEETKGMTGQTVFKTFNGVDTHTYFVGHPDGRYVYIIAKQAHCIYKAIYNTSTEELNTPTVLVGKVNESGYVDGPGTTARVKEPRQGVFVKNPDYVAAGKSDIYDFYFCDSQNHCIRKVTPEGVVSTYAGRGSASSDGSVSGYIDGDLRTEARFNLPVGIVYDEKEETFYITDANNHRIRTITKE